MDTALTLKLSERDRLVVARALVAEMADPAARQVFGLRSLSSVHYQPEAEPAVVDVVQRPGDYVACRDLFATDEYAAWQERIQFLLEQEARQIAQRVYVQMVLKRGRGLATPA